MSDRLKLDKFLKRAKVQARFFDKFQIAYDTHVGTNTATADAEKADGSQAAATADAANEVGNELATEDKKKSDVSPTDVTSFRQSCEQSCAKEIEARVVLLIAEGTQAEIQAWVTSTRLYSNLTEHAPLMGFYDVKNARLCTVFEGMGLTHREPGLDDFRWT